MSSALQQHTKHKAAVHQELVIAQSVNARFRVAAQLRDLSSGEADGAERGRGSPCCGTGFCLRKPAGTSAVKE